MPSKSKRNRRAFSQRAAAQRAMAQNKVEAAASSVADGAAPAVSTPAQSQKITGSYRQTSRVPAAEPIVVANFSREIKWIGLVAGIIVVLLIASFYIFK